jgi:hypothetical protein
MSNRLSKIFQSSKTSHIELQADDHYEFDLEPESEL